MTDLNRILTKPGSYNANEECVDIEVEAGKLVVDFVEELDTKHYRALNMMGNYAGQTVGVWRTRLLTDQGYSVEPW